MDVKHEIKELQHRVKRLEKPLLILEKDNVPCTAELEVKLQKLAAYFTKRAKENKKRAEREERIFLSLIHI